MIDGSNEIEQTPAAVDFAKLEENEKSIHSEIQEGYIYFIFKYTYIPIYIYIYIPMVFGTFFVLGQPQMIDEAGKKVCF